MIINYLNRRRISLNYFRCLKCGRFLSPNIINRGSHPEHGSTYNWQCPNCGKWDASP